MSAGRRHRVRADAALPLAASGVAVALVAWLTPVALLLAAPWLAALAWVAHRRGLTSDETVRSAGERALERALHR